MWDHLTAVEVDPRYATQVDENPKYRIDFWRGSSECDSWMLEGASDVMEALQRANHMAGGRTIVIYSQTDYVQPVLSKVYGIDPSDPATARTIAR